jgi:hypothetical protein
MMTDADLNRAVAAAPKADRELDAAVAKARYGPIEWRQCRQDPESGHWYDVQQWEEEGDSLEPCYNWLDTQGPIEKGWTAEDIASTDRANYWYVAPFVSSSPAAWGALLQELAAKGSVSLSYIEERGQWFATVTREPAIYSGWDAEQPGRAVAMAFLGSKEHSNA